MVGIWLVVLASFSIILIVVRESATPDCKENKEADAGSRLFLKAFFVRRVVVKLFIVGV